MRVTSSIWVGAFLRRCFAAGAMATVARKGAADAGAIFVKVNRLDGRFDLYGPAPQAVVDSAGPRERLFESLIAGEPEARIDRRIADERSFDPDLWLVEIEDREARHFLDLA